jgi:hypothetical protein
MNAFWIQGDVALSTQALEGHIFVDNNAQGLGIRVRGAFINDQQAE